MQSHEVGGAWLAQPVELVTLDLQAGSMSPTLGEEFTVKEKGPEVGVC